MENHVITLRGHHLRILKHLYSGDCLLEEILPGRIRHYGKEMANREFKDMSKILTGKCTIILTDSFNDDLCTRQCGMYHKEKCENLLRQEDRATLRKYSLKIGMSYSSKVVLKRLGRLGLQNAQGKQ